MLSRGIVRSQSRVQTTASSSWAAIRTASSKSVVVHDRPSSADTRIVTPSRTISNSRRLSARADVGSSRIDARSKPGQRQRPAGALEADQRPFDGVRDGGLAEHRVDARLATPAAGAQLRGRGRRAPRRLAEVGAGRRPRIAAGEPAAPGAPACTVSVTGSGDGQTIGQ